MKLQNIHHDITFFLDKIKNTRIADESDANFAHHLTSNIWTVHTNNTNNFQILFTIIQNRCRHYIHICIDSLCNSLIVKKCLLRYNHTIYIKIAKVLLRKIILCKNICKYIFYIFVFFFLVTIEINYLSFVWFFS